MTEKDFSYEIGQKASLSKRITLDDIEAYARLTGDANPVHLDEELAGKTRFKGRIAHGLLGAGLISAVLGTKLPGSGAIYLSQELKFLRPVYPGDEITAEAEVTSWHAGKSRLELDTRCWNQDGEQVISGQAVLLVEPIGP
jgi:3-hydroxybutyryl-CoA dehydratase